MISDNEISRWEKIDDWEFRPSQQRWVHHYVLFPEYHNIIKNISCNSILDFGCGDGLLANFLHNNFSNLSISAYDVVDKMRDIAKRNTTGIHVLDSLAGMSFDVICLNMVLQDVVDPVDLLNSLSDYLNPNGSLIISIPHPIFSLVEANHATTIRERITFPYSKGVHDYSRYLYQESEKVFWSHLGDNWTYLYNRTIQTYSEFFSKSNFFIRKIREPVAISAGQHESTLYDIFTKQPGIMFFICKTLQPSIII